jgi:hypothetical protein
MSFDDGARWILSRHCRRAVDILHWLLRLPFDLVLELLPNDHDGDDNHDHDDLIERSRDDIGDLQHPCL